MPAITSDFNHDLQQAQHEALLLLRRLQQEAAQPLENTPCEEDLDEYALRTRRIDLRFRIAQAILRTKPREEPAPPGTPDKPEREPPTDRNEPADPPPQAAPHANNQNAASPSPPRTGEAQVALLNAASQLIRRKLRAH